MPELPEVETVVRDLRPVLIGRVFLGVSHGELKLRHAWNPDWNRVIIGSKVHSIERRAKWIVIDLGAPGTVLVHLGMTGQLTTQPADSPMADHVHLRFQCDAGMDLRYRDIRRFGGAEFHAGPNGWKERLKQAGLGPEPWDMKKSDWLAALAGSRRPIKSILLDQRVLVGLGNIYADESLFQARIHPLRLGSSLQPKECGRLLASACSVLDRAIASRGSTIRDYVGGSGLRGGYQESLAVYGREGMDCGACAGTVVRQVISGRSAHFCPSCQPIEPGGSGSGHVVP